MPGDELDKLIREGFNWIERPGRRDWQPDPPKLKLLTSKPKPKSNMDKLMRRYMPNIFLVPPPLRRYYARIKLALVDFKLWRGRVKGRIPLWRIQLKSALRVAWLAVYVQVPLAIKRRSLTVPQELIDALPSDVKYTWRLALAYKIMLLLPKSVLDLVNFCMTQWLYVKAKRELLGEKAPRDWQEGQE